MKKTILFCFGLCLAMLLPCISLQAQVVDSPRSYTYIVRYDKNHTLMRQGSDFNVVDLDMEWPVVIDSTQVSTLQQQIASTILMSDAVDYDIAMRDFLVRYGTPVSGKLDSLPDDRHFCYVTASSLEGRPDELSTLLHLSEKHAFCVGESWFNLPNCVETGELSDYAGSECFYAAKDYRWLIYFSHEDTVSFAGSIVPMIKERFGEVST